MHKILSTTFFIGLLTFSARAHSRTEIGYRFIAENDKTYLEVHLTSSTIFDLLYDLYPELKSRASLNLSHYTSDYESYFNEHIDLLLNNSAPSLTYIKSNLITHDASVTFLIEGLEDQISSYDITIGGFDFYQKPSFTIFFTTPSMTEMCRLSKENNRCTGALQEIAQVDGTSYAWPWWLLLGVPTGWSLVWILKRRSIKTAATL